MACCDGVVAGALTQQASGSAKHDAKNNAAA